jgi:hypothetical protein
MAALRAAFLFLGFAFVLTLSTAAIEILNGLWKDTPDGVSFHKPKKSTNDIGLLYTLS